MYLMSHDPVLSKIYPFHCTFTESHLLFPYPSSPRSFLWQNPRPSHSPPMATISSRLLFNQAYSPLSSIPTTKVANFFQMAGRGFEFEDFLPIIAEKLGEEGLIAELCNGFRLLMDPARGLITFESLKRNAAVLGLDGMGDDELRGMLREGDFDGDGALSEMEFCALMVRLSPELMDESWRIVDEAFQQTFSSP